MKWNQYILGAEVIFHVVLHCWHVIGEYDLYFSPAGYITYN